MEKNRSAMMLTSFVYCCLLQRQKVISRTFAYAICAYLRLHIIVISIIATPILSYSVNGKLYLILCWANN